MTVKELK